MPNGTNKKEEELLNNEEVSNNESEVQIAPNPPLNTNEKSEDEAPSWFDKARKRILWWRGFLRIKKCFQRR